jgi:putative heme-binding domain-containing protein
MRDLRRQLSDPTLEVAARNRALAALLAIKDAELPILLQSLLKDAGMRGDALRGLAAYDDPKTPEAILGVYPDLTLAEKRDALNTLASRSAFAQQLLAGVRSGAVPVRDLTADIIRQLRGFKNVAIDAQVTALWGVARESGEDKLKEIAAYKATLKSGPAGNPVPGRIVFARICQQCHTLFDVGGKVGPDITGSNRGDLDYILHNILDPNAEIPNDYQVSTVDTKDDRVITGIITAQDGNALTIVTANDTILLPRAEVQAIQKSSLSMMPEGLAQALSETELRDLIAYLRSPAQVPMPDDEDQPQGR